ncbi:MAG: monooxygenase [Rhodospirillaceae bacterium]|nr:monooxygenase [Rhodospirillaceae bacterium]
MGREEGVLRLLADEPSKAWTFLTTVYELKGFEEKTGVDRPTGEAYSRNFGGANWLDQRMEVRKFSNREPTVLVVGGGQAGLAIAARLGQLEIDTLVIDKHERIGDNWRKRYHSLALHNQIHVNHMPYFPFPPTWPKYIPKDMLANWFEVYTEVMQINFWESTEFINGSYDEEAGAWSATIRQGNNRERTINPRHIILANGVSGIPYIPNLPGLDKFEGEVLHSEGFSQGGSWDGKRAIVLGTGNSGHDVAQDLHSHGAKTSIIQRGSTTVVSIDPSAKLNYALYDEGPPLEDCDLIASAATYPLIVKGYQLAVKKMAELDDALITGLVRRGFKYDLGEDGTGHQMKYRRRGGGYYLNAGCSELIISGEIDLIQFDEIEKFVEAGILMKNGAVEKMDVLVLATGYYTQNELVKRLLGTNIAERVGQIWGIGQDGELANMWKKTPQEGLWFIAGSLAQCRIYSKYLALQIKAIEENLI